MVATTGRAYLTVGECFPLEMRAMAIAVFYAFGTAVGGIAAPALFGALITLLFVPWLDTSRVRSSRFRPVYKQFFWFLVADAVILGYVGANRVDATLFSTGIPMLVVGRIATFYYFAHFWIVMPLVGLFETPKPLPDSIAKPVLGTAAE